MKKATKKILAVVLAVVTLLGACPVAASAASTAETLLSIHPALTALLLIVGAYPTVMWLTPLGLLAPVIWVAHKIVLLLALITPPPANEPLWEAVHFIAQVLYPMWGIIW